MDKVKAIMDKCLQEMSKEKILMMIPGDIPEEMVDNSIEPVDDLRRMGTV